MKRYLRILDGFTPLLVMLLLQGVVQYGAIFGHKVFTAGQEPSDEFKYYVSIISVIITGIVFYQWYQKNQKETGKKTGASFRLKEIFWCIVMGFSMQFFISGCLSLITPLFTDAMEEYGKVIESIYMGPTGIVFIYIVIIAPIVEELIFRGVVLHRARKALPFLGANLLQAAAFGIFHGNVIQGIFTFFMGLILGYIVQKHETIWRSIIVHMALNGASYVVIFVPNKLPFLMLVTIIGGAFIAISGCILLKGSKIQE